MTHLLPHNFPLTLATFITALLLVLNFKIVHLSIMYHEFAESRKLCFDDGRTNTIQKAKKWGVAVKGEGDARCVGRDQKAVRAVGANAVAYGVGDEEGFFKF